MLLIAEHTLMRTTRVNNEEGNDHARDVCIADKTANFKSSLYSRQ
jgi:hypothetical protein